MKKLSVVVIVTFVCFALRSCSLLPEPKKWNELKFRNPEKNGIIFGTFSSSSPISLYRGYWGNLTYPAKNKKKLAYLLNLAHGEPCCMAYHKHNGELDNGQTYFFIAELKEGQYELTSVNLEDANSMWINYKKITNFSYPIDIKKGKITYIGNISLDENHLEGDSLVKIHDNFEKDFKGIQTYVRKLDWNSVDKTSEIKIKYLKH